MYKICIEEFEGPLDLLYHLIDKNKIDIYDIPIAEITDQYIQHLEAMKELNLEVTSEFVVIAANLLEIKSKMLLPKVMEEEDPREDLVNKLLEYKKYKLASEDIKARQAEFDKIYYKLKDELELSEESAEALDFDINKLLSTYQKVMEGYRKRALDEEAEDKLGAVVRDIEREELSVEDGMKFIAGRLDEVAELRFMDLFDTLASRNRIVTMFMSLLELIKRRKIKAVQENLFGDIILVGQ